MGYWLAILIDAEGLAQTPVLKLQREQNSLLAFLSIQSFETKLGSLDQCRATCYPEDCSHTMKIEL